MPQPILRWTRWGDGPDGQPMRVVVRPLADGSRVIELGDERYEGAKGERELLRLVVGDRRAPHWTVDRYLGLGKADDRDAGVAAWTILDLLSVGNGRPPAIRDAAPVVGRSPAGAVGIDLAGRGHEVAKLLWAGFGHRIVSSGYDFDDVLQEVHKGLLARNAGKCAWDPSKSSFGHYVHMVCGCILSNYHRRMARLRRHEQVGMRIGRGRDEGHGAREVDAGSDGASTVAAAIDWSATTLMDATAMADLAAFLERDGTADGALAAKALPLVAAGLGRTEVAEALGASRAQVARALAAMRTMAAEWAGSRDA